ncbi:MAG TPA: hypothetical protein VJZ00_11935 [Thermoanaerobaculia bacterium]|nr:hypothetical protein [Thermoanaerobaculia bacterium]
MRRKRRRGIVRRTARHSSEDIHHAVFAKSPRLRTSHEMKEGIIEYLRKKHARD